MSAATDTGRLRRTDARASLVVSALVVATLVVSALACGDARPPETSRGWVLEVEATIQPDEGTPGELIAPNDLAFTPDGGLLVADSRPSGVKRFDAAGTYRATIGGEGKGPGEFENAWIAVSGEVVAVQDPANARLSFFSWRTGAFDRDARSTCCIWFPIHADTAAQRIVLRMMPIADSAGLQRQRFERIPVGGGRHDTLMVVSPARGSSRQWTLRVGGGAAMTIPVPLQPSQHYAVAPGGGVVVGWSGEDSVRLTRDGADTVMRFGLVRERVPVTAERRAAAIERTMSSLRESLPFLGGEAKVRAQLDPATLPGTSPAFERILVDGQGRSWLRRIAPDTTTVLFDLFDSSGAWLGPLAFAADQWPRESWAPIATAGDRVAVILEDEGGRPLVRTFRMRRAPLTAAAGAALGRGRQ